MYIQCIYIYMCVPCNASPLHAKVNLRSPNSQTISHIFRSFKLQKTRLAPKAFVDFILPRFNAFFFLTLRKSRKLGNSLASSIVVSTHLRNTPLNLYQQFIMGFLS